MPDLIYLLAVLACPITMGVMMLVMMRSGGHDQRRSSVGDTDEVARLRAEADRLRGTQDPTSGGAPDRAPSPG